MVDKRSTDLPGKAGTPHLCTVRMVHGGFGEFRTLYTIMSDNSHKSPQLLVDVPVRILVFFLSAFGVEKTVRSVIDIEVRKLESFCDLLSMFPIIFLITPHKLSKLGEWGIAQFPLQSRFPNVRVTYDSDQNKGVLVQMTKQVYFGWCRSASKIKARGFPSG
ncbi:MAG: hypothetical protein WDM89_19480 [Rhizomicrobium sp.]